LKKLKRLANFRLDEPTASMYVIIVTYVRHCSGQILLIFRNKGKIETNGCYRQNEWKINFKISFISIVYSETLHFELTSEIS